LSVIPKLPRISDYVSWHAARQPEAIALSLHDVQTSYAELARRVDELARALLTAGVKKGDRVATLQTPHPDYVVAFLASASIGAIWLGLNPRYKIAELRRALFDADPVILLTRTAVEDRRYDPEINSLRAASPGLERIVVFHGDPLVPGAESMQAFLAGGRDVSAQALEATRSACGERDPCLIVYTSGSSGNPKGALLHHEGITTISHSQNAVWPVNPYSIVNYFPINHVGCVVDCTTPCLVAGGTLHFMEHFEPRDCLELMVKRRVTIWGSVPSAFQLQTEVDGFDEYDLSAVQLIAWGGAAMPEPLIRRLLRICPRLCTNYGMTESCGTITTVEPTDDVDILANTVGQGISAVEIRLFGTQGAGVDVAGELQVRSRCNFLEYWRNHEATSAAFTSDGFFRTGDLAIQRPDGRYRLVGRLSDMYKSGGYNVYPREIEAVLEEHPSITRAAVVSLHDPLWQEVGIAYVVAMAPVTSAQLDAHCRAHLAAYKIPKRIVIESELPLLPIGKVDKRALRERAALLSRGLPSADR
jgi:acyl-CoA synthetase (AMP-forming)/AMP-acid ligase II